MTDYFNYAKYYKSRKGSANPDLIAWMKYKEGVLWRDGLKVGDKVDVLIKASIARHITI